MCIMYRATIFMYCRHAYSSSSISSEPTSHSMKPTPQHACLWGLRCMRYMVHTHKHLTHKHTHAYTRTHAYMHAHACTHTHTHTHTQHTHTHTHTHTHSLIWRGWRHSLEYSDLTDLNYEDKSRVVAPRFQRNWDNQIRKAGCVCMCVCVCVCVCVCL